jgi:DNA repair exonuclease SbcCD nuclease subunit
MGDCHLGGWRQPELSKLNFESFQQAIKTAITEKANFILIAGDLFDSAYPSLEILKETFNEFRKIKEAKIPVFLIAGSHDYSVSGKTFLDVLEKAGFVKNVFIPEERNGAIILQPTIFEKVAIYGYPGKKSGLEVPEISKLKIEDAPGFFKILMLHTTLKDAIGSLPIPGVDHKDLPKVDYLALAHLHINYNKEGRVYCGPTFPNNLEELEELQGGSFYIVNIPGEIQKREIKIKEILTINLEINNSLEATDKIISELKNKILKNKIIILKLKGILDIGKPSDIDFHKIENYIKNQEAYVFLKSTTKLKIKETEIKLELKSNNLEEEIIKKFQEENPNELNKFIPELMNSLELEKKEDERSKIFEERLFEDIKKILEI